jgi:hypothetical protein
VRASTGIERWVNGLSPSKALKVSELETGIIVRTFHDVFGIDCIDIRRQPTGSGWVIRL